MTLAPGTRIGPYEVVGPLGAGGMGEVYRARDTNLDRDVALKILPEAWADDGERLARFEREARTLAALNHPNIAQVYGLEALGSIRAIAMELVEGRTLEAAIGGRGLPLEEALPIARQITGALEAAHEQGVVHRDLKPANVMLTADDQAKVLDFGLATAMGPAATSGGVADSPTMTARATQMGMIIGTAAYMSPEQARGKAVDKRADIWAFGAVFHELLTGERLFAGDDVSETLASVIKDQPDLSGAPREVRRLLDRCLQKNPRERLRDIGDVWALYDDAAEPAAPASKTRRGRWVAAAAVVAVAAALSGWWLRGDAAPAGSWSQLTQLTDAAGEETGPAFSPDGNSFAYSGRAAGSWDIYVQRVGGRNPIPIAADPERDEAWPAFSPDGRLVAYNEDDRDGGIWVVGATGESDRRVTDFGFNPAWSPDGKHIAFASGPIDSPYDRGRNSTLWRVPAAGGEPVQLGERDAVQPAWSPSGARIAFWFQEGGQRDLATVSADGADRVDLLEDAPLDWSPTWSPDGKYLYFSSDRGGSLGLWRLAVDEASGRAEGEPESVANGLEASMSLPGFPADGRALIFRSQTRSINPVVIPFDPAAERAGVPRELLRRFGILRPSSVSPDGEWLALFSAGEPQEDIFLMRTDDTGLRRLTDDVARDRSASFSSDGALLAFHSNRDGEYAAYAIRVDGSALTQLTEASLGNVGAVTFEPHGDRILFYGLERGLLIAGPPWPVAPDAAKSFPNLELADAEWKPGYNSWSWSPDGKRIVGTMLSESRTGIGLYDPTSMEGRLVVEEDGTSAVRWLPDSRRVVYFTRNWDLAVLDVDTGSRRLVPLELPLPPGDDKIALAPDGTVIYYGGERIESNIWMLERGR